MLGAEDRRSRQRRETRHQITVIKFREILLSANEFPRRGCQSDSRLTS